MKKPANSTAVVIVAAGRGLRAGQAAGPKQYVDLGGSSVLNRTIRVFAQHDKVDHIIVVIHADDEDLYRTSIQCISKLLPHVHGGTTRQLSVLAGLEALKDFAPEKVLIHDGARPFVDDDTINRVLHRLDTCPAVLPALPVSDTLKKCDDSQRILQTVDRSNLYSAQTPQGFAYPTILQLHRNAISQGRDDFSDDTGLAEWSGIEVVTVEGGSENIKLTTAEDIRLAQGKFTMTVPDIRVGHGYDTHQFTEGTHIWLCGVELKHDRSLQGHSDADVGLHALTDALLATIADGDIGSHFPPSDPQWRGARSDQFLKHAVARVGKMGGRITHMDITLVCEAPKVGPHRDAMRQAICDITGIEMDRISVKATTNERIGFVGRNEGMVALATATVVMEGAA